MRKRIKTPRHPRLLAGQFCLFSIHRVAVAAVTSHCNHGNPLPVWNRAPPSSSKRSFVCFFVFYLSPPIPPPYNQLVVVGVFLFS